MADGNTAFEWDVVVVGAGAAGLVAAERAAHRGRRTLLLEKSRKPGVKILISGGTRCNLTHSTDAQGIVAAYGPPGRFLHSALAALSPQDLVALVEREGVATKIEPTGKIFPASDRAADILAAFLRRLRRTGCQLALGEALISLVPEGDGFRLTTSLRCLTAARVIVTTGGQSYPGCGTTGDGFRWAVELGHRLVPPRPALVPVTTNDAWVRALQGVTIPDVAVRVIEPPLPARTNGDPPPGRTGEPTCLDVRRGSFLFAHFGMSGPVVLDCSRAVSGHPRPHSLALECDFLPDLSEAAIDDMLHAAAGAAGKKQLIAILPEALPRRLCEALVAQAELTPESKAAELSRVGRARLAQAIKRTWIAVSGTRGFAKAEVTAGGVALGEVDSRTLQSKLVPNLYWAGEVLDLDGPIGGYNFQAAFSTGWLAGESA
jgi:predicted flavoprotein YhiN